MTQQEIEDELKSLRELRKKWRSISKTAGLIAIVFWIGGAGFFAFSIAYPSTRHDTFSAAMIFLMLSLPMTLLSTALREP